ncbi:50S ribosomal protein L15 [Gracilariopsis chorda]|uniref:50S ribosomal protein L15 n=1 Tax=Gracilariopsis chorda TaxID=448386 RepID=A0A2V3IDE1_9FLOR|nr:50S ribosomal protein L15 [Gracilariopsis chorda]|eukprot:PXF40105.1 50S ribosomal protein L15 [Gracilariopsis chorda]
MQPTFVAPLGRAPKHPTYIGLRPSTCRLPTRPPATARPASRVSPTAKIFDWKKRQDPDYNKLPEEDDGIFKFTNLRPAPGSRHRKKRKGRGDAAGQGARCGFGMRGQKSRSGRSVRPGFEGGQTPLYRRIPKFVGRPTGPGHKKTEYALLKIEHLNGCEEGEIVTFEGMKEKGIVTKQKRKIYKVVGGAELTVQNLTVKAHAFTTSAVEAIEGAGGTCVLISPTTGKDIVLDDDDENDDVEEQPVAADEESSDTEEA